MNVTKKELAIRSFTPYEITITVTDEKEHNDLQKALDNLKSENLRWWKPSSEAEHHLKCLLDTILNHTK